MKHRTLSLLCLLGVLLSGTGWAKDFEALTMAVQSDARSLDPQQSVDTLSFSVTKHIYEPLVTVDGRTRQLVPVLAESWEQLDPETYRFHLRQGVKFHNGEELTAEDVVFSLLRNTTPDSVYSGSRGQYLDPEGFKVEDKYTVIVKTKGPVGGFLESMKHPYASIFNKKAVLANGQENFRNPVGTGPFRLDSWIKGDRIVLKAFDDYWGEKPNFQTLNVLVIPDDSSRIIALETGRVDLVYGVPFNDYERLNAPGSNVKAVRGTGLALVYLGANMQKEKLSDPRVRLALDYAINKEALNMVVYLGNSETPAGPLLPASTFYPQGVEPVPYDPAKAKELLTEAGYGDGMHLSLWISDSQERVNAATVVQSMLAQVGITVDVQVFESGVFDDRMRDGEHDLIISQWGMQTNRNAVQFWLPLFASEAIGSTNWTGVKDPKVDQAIQTLLATTDTDEAEVLYMELWDYLVELHSMTPLAIPSELYGGRKDLMGLEDLCDGKINYLGNLYLSD